eukprot:CAMPEP_0203751674 /NCGR_PEP_ID=MMETSP0098-20131031/5711_1 /ASSEMBLY_ACC=CAM_ASM_000208 /TAXON_ID=96639 /ORGANISM=" , Strain NY0313808BC1" /LENGTH=325 /DNA_ID=CAMNT_0050641509 /DNA_START=51 /DNA_END=1025 /DNA_ORIENTATION=+
MVCLLDYVDVVDLWCFSAGDGNLPLKRSDLSGAQESTVVAWEKSMRECGFAIVKNHGLDKGVVERVFQECKGFFVDKSLEDKRGYTFGAYGNTRGGYTSQSTESVARTLNSTQAPPDLVESYVLTKGALKDPTGHYQPLYSAGKAHFEQAEQMMHVIHALSALALGVDSNYFDQFHKDPKIALRMSAYAPVPDTVQDGQLRYGAHHDYQGFTILTLQDDTPDQATGLEIYFNGEWVPVVLPEGCVVVNIGELMSFWTDGRWRSTLHRVVLPPKGSDAYKSYRFSLPFFTGPSDDVLVSPINGDGSKAPILSGEHLRQKLQNSAVQ